MSGNQWIEKTIGELTEPKVSQIGPKGHSDFVYVDIGSIDRETKRIVDPKVLAVAMAPSRAKQVLKSGDVVVSMTRPNLNAISLIPNELDGAIGSTGFQVLRARDVESSFLLYALQTREFVDAMSQKVQGALYPAVRPKDITSYVIRLPASLTEQQRIVAEIEKQFTRLDAGVAALKRAQANLKRYRAAVLKTACEGKLVPTEAELARAEGRGYESGEELLQRILGERRVKWNGRGKYKEPVAPNVEGLAELPKGWVWASLDQLLLNITDGDHLPPPKTNSGIPLLVIGNIGNGSLSFKNTRFVSQSYFDAIDTLRKPHRGDILYTLVGSFGIALRVNTDRKFCIQRHISVMRPHSLSPSHYLAHILNSGFVFRQATTSATGTAQKTVPLAGLRCFKIPLPPLVEQHRIVAEVERRLSVIEEMEAAVSSNLRRAGRLRQAVLQWAFSGRL